jgi:hypothetical protein
MRQIKHVSLVRLAGTDRIWTLLVIAGGLVLSTVGAADAVTVAEAKTFWKEFDDHTLHGKGPRVNEVYGVVDPTNAAQVAAARVKVRRDIFDAFSDTAGRAIAIEILDAHGRAVPAADRMAVETAYAGMKTNGTLDRLSRLQLGVIRDHFSTGGVIDLVKFQEAVELLANGELRGGANPREMDQLNQWYVWKQFAAQAVQRDVNKAEWEKILKSLEKALEIYERVYPGRDPAASGLLKLTDSGPARFDGTKQLTGPQKAALRLAIDGLTTAQVLAREQDHLKDVTQGAAAPHPPSDMQLARLDIFPVTGGLFVDFEVRLTDELNDPVIDALVDLIARDTAPVLLDEAFSLAMGLAHLGGGLYGAEFIAPGVVTGLAFLAIEHGSVLAISEARSFVPAPATLVLVATGIALFGLERLTKRRRRDR